MHFCKSELQNTKECKEFLRTSRKETHTKAEQLTKFQTKKTSYNTLPQTSEFKNYEIAKKLHETYNTSETLTLVEDAAIILLEVPETKEILKEIEKRNIPTSHSDEMYSDNVINKHHIMEQTTEWIQYEEAKEYHKIYGTPITRKMVDVCLAELHKTKECQEWLYAMDQEKHVMENIMKSERWNKTHQKTIYNFSDASEEEIDAKIKFAQETKKRRKDAFDKVQNTPQFQHYLITEAQYKKDKSPMNLLRFKQSKYLLNVMPESLEYGKAIADERLLLAIHRGYIGPIVVEQNYPSCWVDYVEQEKMMHKLDLDVLHIRQKGALIVYISQ